MRKALPMLGLLMVLAGVIGFTLRRTGTGGGGSGEKISIERAAELAPAEATFFVAIPELERMGAWWRQNGVLAIDEDPTCEGTSWRTHAEMLIERAELGTQQLRLGSWAVGNRKCVILVEDLKKIRAEGLFYAAVERARQETKFVGGVSYRAKKSEVEGVMRKMKERLFAAWPGAMSELSSEQGIEIESIRSPQAYATQPVSTVILPTTLPELPAVHIAFRDNWVFVATDRALLAGTLARYVGAKGAGESLAANASFAECRRHALPRADACLWAGKFGMKTPMVSRSANGAAGEIDAVHYDYEVGGATDGRLYLKSKWPVAESGEGSLAIAGAGARAEKAGEPWWNVIRVMANTYDDPFDAARQGWGWGGEPWPPIPDVPVLFINWGRRALPESVLAMQVRETEAFRIGEAMVAAEREGLREEGRRALWDWTDENASAPLGPWGAMERQERRSWRAGLMPGNEERKRSWETQCRKPEAARMVVGQEGAFYYLEIPENLAAVEATEFYGELYLAPRWGKPVVYTQPSPGTIRVRKDGEGWLIESTGKILGPALIDRVLPRGHP